MAASVDEKVVQLTLDNKQFNKASKDTIDSLDDLKRALEFEGAIDSFDELEREIDNIDFSPIDRGIENVGHSFSVLDTITDTIFRNMTNRVVDFGMATIKSLSTDQISSGWEKYAEQTGAVQTIMAATANQFSDTGKQMEVVNEQLEKLTWFTDETSHKFNDMVGGIGKFTANNIDLDTSVKAMEGIATWASLSGANANEASRAIYNLAQAISVGSVKLMDWKSIQNANMATSEFNQTVIDTAINMGTVTKIGKDMYQVLGDSKNVYSSVSLFSDGLQKAWFSSEVLLESLDKYGGYADRLHDFVEETDILTATAMNMVDSYVDGTLNMQEAMDITQLSADELITWLEELGSEEYALGRRALAAAQETKTFQEAIDYVKEAVSSGWSASFKYIFGDYLEAKEWWSEIAETMYEVFVVGGEIRNSILEIWKEGGGRDDFLEGIREGLTNAKELLDIFKNAWNEVWFGDAANQIRNQANMLLKLTKGFKDLMKALKPTEATTKNLNNIFKSIFSILKSGVNVLKAIAQGLSPIADLLNIILGTSLQVAADALQTFSMNVEQFFNPTRLQKIADVLTIISSILSGVMQVGLGVVFVLLEKMIVAVQSIYNQIRESGGGIKGVITVLINTVEDLWNSFMQGETVANKVADVIMFIFTGLAAGVKLLVDKLVGLITGEVKLGDIFSGQGAVTDAINGFDTILEKLDLQDKFEKIMTVIRDFCMDLVAADGIITTFVNNIVDAIRYLWDALRRIIDDVELEDIKDLLLISILWNYVAGLNKLNSSLTSTVKSFGGIVENFNKFFKEFTVKDVSTPVLNKLNTMFNKSQYLQMGIAVTLLVAALGKLNSLDYEKTQQSVAALGVTLAMLLAAMKVFSKIANALPKGSGKLSDTVNNAVENLGKNMMFIGIAALSVAQALKVLNEVLPADPEGLDFARYFFMLSNVALIVTFLAEVTNMMGSIETKGVGNLVSILAVAVGVRLIVDSVKAMSKIAADPAQLAVSALGVSGIILALGKSVEFMGKIDWKTALSVIPLILSISLSMITIVGAIAILVSLAKGNNLAGALGTFLLMIISLTGALVILGQALKNVKPATLNAISGSLLAFGAAFVILAGALKLLESYDWEGSAQAVKALGGYFVMITGALMLLGVVLDDVDPTRITAIGFAMIEMAGSIFILSASLKMINGIDYDSIKDGVSTIIGLFAAFTLLAGIVAVFDVQYFGMVSKSLEVTAEAFLKFSLAVAAVSAAIFMLSAAAGVMATIIAAFQALADKFGIDLPTAISTGFDTLELIIREFLEMLRNLVGDFTLTFAALFGAVVLAIYAVKFPAVMAVVELVVALANELSRHGEDFVDALTKIVNTINEADKLFKALEDLCGTIGEFIGRGIVNAIFGFLKGALGGLWDKITHLIDPRELSEKINDSYNEALRTLGDEESNEIAKQAANRTLASIIKAWIDGEESVSDEMALTAMKAMGEFADTASSESRNAVHSMFEEFQKGIKEKEGDYTDIMEYLGSTLEPAMGKGADPDVPWDAFRGSLTSIREQLQLGADDEGGLIGMIFSGLGELAGDSFMDSLSDIIGDNPIVRLVTGKKKEPDYSHLTAKQRKEMERIDPAEIVEEVIEESENDIIDDYYGLGLDAAKELGKGLSTGTRSSARSATKAAEKEVKEETKTAAELIAEEFADALEKVSRDTQLSDKLYKLWQAENPTADEMAKQAKEIEYQSEKVAIATEKASLTQQIYQRTLEEMGESAKETHEAYMDMLDDQIALLDGQNKLAELQKGTTENTQEAWERYDALVRGTDVNALMNMGFTTEQISRALAQQAGYAMPEAIDKMKSDTLGAVASAAEETADAYAQAVTVTLSSGEIIELCRVSGEGLTEAIADGAVSSSDILTESTMAVNQEAVDTMTSNDVMYMWRNVGKNIDAGTADGVAENTDIPVDAIGEMAEALVNEGEEALEINSPSKKFYYIGEMIIEGLVNAIEDGRSTVVNTIIGVIEQAVASAKAAAGIASPSTKFAEIGMYMDLGLVNGITKYTGKAESATKGMINRLMDTTNDTIYSNRDVMNKYLREVFDVDEESMHISVVLDLDSENVDGYLSELERVQTLDYNQNNISQNADPALYSDKLGRYQLDTSAYKPAKFNELADLLDSYIQEAKVRETTVEDTSEENVQNITFTQNNYSPKAISRVDTYRDTQRQLNTFARKFSINKRYS